MGRLAYLAHPIDLGGVSPKKVIHVTARLMEQGWVVFSPAGAFSTTAAPGPEIEEINRYALVNSSLLIALLPAGVRTIGVPRELEYAKRMGIPILVWAPEAGWALADLETHPKLKGLLAAIPAPDPRQHPPGPGDGTSGLLFHLEEGAQLPSRAHPQDVGFDLYSSHDVLIEPGGFADVGTGVRVALPPGVWANIVGRSSTWRKWKLHAVPGVIDSGYRGLLYSAVQNPGTESVFVPAGTRLTQIILSPNLATGYTPTTVDRATFDRLDGDSRGEQGFGSSGS